jgi:hypothetical protein
LAIPLVVQIKLFEPGTSERSYTREGFFNFLPQTVKIGYETKNFLILERIKTVNRSPGDMNGEKVLGARFPATNGGVKPMTHPPINGRMPSR